MIESRRLEETSHSSDLDAFERYVSIVINMLIDIFQTIKLLDSPGERRDVRFYNSME